MQPQRSGGRLALAIVIGLSISTSQANATPAVVEETVNCMLANTTKDIKELLRKLYLAALKNDEKDAKDKLFEFDYLATKLATETCKIKGTAIEEGEAKALGEKYTHALGEQVLLEAFAEVQ